MGDQSAKDRLAVMLTQGPIAVPLEIGDGGRKGWMC
jgi:hypothetical protein